MPLLPLIGHEALRRQLHQNVAAGTLPQSLLLYGPRGVGKQRLALWLAQCLLCERAPGPCGSCQHCRLVLDLTHPDLTWVFPHERPKGDASLDDIKRHVGTLAAERASAHGLYPAPPGSEGIFIDTIRVLVQQAVATPALARRKVFVVGDAERMVAQEGAEFAANAFLKLLEEPPADTFLVLTTSALGALLPTIRSRVAAVRVRSLDPGELQHFLMQPTVSSALDDAGLPKGIDERAALAGGAPGALFGMNSDDQAQTRARRLLDAATSGDRAAMLRAAFAQGVAGARGTYTGTLDALTQLLRERTRSATLAGDARTALAASRASDAVEEARMMAAGNVNPQLVTAALVQAVARHFHP